MNQSKTELGFYNAAICNISDHLSIPTLMNCEISNKCDNFSPHIAWNKCTEEHFDLFQVFIRIET